MGIARARSAMSLYQIQPQRFCSKSRLPLRLRAGGFTCKATDDQKRSSIKRDLV